MNMLILALVLAFTAISPAVATPIEVDVSYVYRRAGTNTFNVLRDGGDLRTGDAFKIIFTPKENCYVYIFQVDAAGNLFCLFPMDEFKGIQLNNANPVASGQTYYIPAQGKSFVLDDVRGLEKIYFLASRQPDAELAQYQHLLQIRHGQANISSEQIAELDRMLAKLETTLQGKGQSKGLAVIAPDPEDSSPVHWSEDGQIFSVLRQRLEGLCDGCLNILQFQHR